MGVRHRACLNVPVYDRSLSSIGPGITGKRGFPRFVDSSDLTAFIDLTSVSLSRASVDGEEEEAAALRMGERGGGGGGVGLNRASWSPDARFLACGIFCRVHTHTHTHTHTYTLYTYIHIYIYVTRGTGSVGRGAQGQ